MPKITYSIIIPVFNEEEVLPALKVALDAVLGGLDEPWEVIFVNDGSTDQTEELLGQICRKDGRYKAVHFSRNFGHQAALAAGFDHISGKAIIIMDADLQDPPELLPEFIAKWKEGYDVVYGIRKARSGESWLKKATAAGFYKSIGWFSKIDIPANVSDFRLLDRKVVEQLKRLGEQHLFWRGLIPWVGFRQIGVEFVRRPRAAGASHYPFKKMVKFALDGITSFSTQPLKLAAYVGTVIAGLSFALGVYAIIEKLVYGTSLQGWASLMTAIMFLGGVQLIMIGVLGTYLGRTYEESKKRPRYIVRNKVNLD